MAFLRSSLVQDAAHTVTGRGIVLRPLVMNDYQAWADLRAASRQHLAPWEPAWPDDDLTKFGFRRRLRHYQREVRDDLGYAFAIVEAGSGKLLGGISLSNVRRGVTQAATLGYWVGAPYTGRGLMSEAVRVLTLYATTTLRLHRIEVAVQPNNAPSLRVLEKNGFVREGYARRFLKICGVWTDHVTFAILAEDVAEASKAEAGPT